MLIPARGGRDEGDRRHLGQGQSKVAAREAVGKSRVEIEARTLALMNEQLKWRDALGLQDEEIEQLKRNIAAQKSLMDAVRDKFSKQVEAQNKALLKPSKP